MSTYRLPAEWEEHASTWLSYPSLESDWPGKLPKAQSAMLEIVAALSKYELANLLISKEEEIPTVRESLLASGAREDNLKIHFLETDRSWLRDSAPTMIKSGNSRFWLNWKFNAWAKYDNYKLDSRVPAFVSGETGVGLVFPKHKGRDVVFEGGAIESDGGGTLLVTKECLLSDVQIRNESFAREDYEELFSKYLGVQKVIWLEAGILGDDTHGHIDDVCRFAPDNKVILAFEDERGDQNKIVSKANLEILEKASSASGKSYEIFKLPMPEPILYEGEYLPASYANFYVANQQVLVPVFNDKNDSAALNVISQCFPEREIVEIYTRDLILGLGAIHCLSQTEFK